MTEYNITFARSARKELEALDVAVLGRVWSRIELLTTDRALQAVVSCKGTRRYGGFVLATTV